MSEDYFSSVQKKPRKNRLRRSAVNGVADDWMPDGLKMHPDLVGASRADLHLEQ